MSSLRRHLWKACLGLLFAGPLAIAQQPPEVDPTRVVGDPPQFPSDSSPGGSGEGTVFSGSPFNNLGGRSGLGTGAPVNVFDTPRSTTIIDQPRIVEQSATTVPELLDNIPGVLLQRTNLGGGSLIIRGRNGNQNLIMVDGIPINDAGWRFANVQYLNTIDPGVVERVEVIRGPASVLYGSGAVGGVVNFVTKSRKNFGPTFGLDGNIISNYSTAIESPYNRGEISANFLNLGVFAGASYFDSGTLHAGQGVDFDQSIVAYDQAGADIRFDWKLSDAWTMTFDYQYLNQNSVPRTDRFPFAGVDPTRFTNEPTFTEPQRRDFGYARLSYLDECADWINGLDLTFHVQRRREIENETRLGLRNAAGVLVNTTPATRRQRSNHEEILNWGADLRGFTLLGDRNTLVYGATYYHDTVHTQRTEIPGVGLPLRSITPSIPSDGRYDQFGVFVTDRHEITDWLIVSAGVRYSDIHVEGTLDERGPNRARLDRSFQDWSAEGGVVVKITDQLNLVGSISEGFRAPNLDDLATSDRSTGAGPDFGAANLNSERVVNYETGLKFQGDRLAAAATYYFTDSPVQIVRTPRAGGGNLRVNTEGFITGVEGEGSYQVTDAFAVFSAASYTFGKDTTLNEPISRINPAFFQVGGRYKFCGPTWNAFVEVWGEMMTEQDRLSASERLDIRIPPAGTAAWQTLNCRAGLQTDDFVRITLGVYNIFDQNYRFHGSGIDAPGFEVRAGYELSF